MALTTETGSGQGPAPRRPRTREGIAIAVAVVVLGAIAWYVLRTPERKGPAEVAEEAAAGLPAPSGPAADGAPAPADPPMDAAAAREAARTLSPDAAYQRWAAEGDLESRWAFVIANVAEGVTPRRVLGPFAPRQPFTVTEQGGRKVIAEASHRRYDGFADAVAAVDARLAARIYRALRPGIEAAYGALGARGTLDAAVGRALQRIERAPVREGVEVVEQGGIWAFADRALEDQDEVTKQLLRMGPRNTRLLQQKARELREALGVR